MSTTTQDAESVKKIKAELEKDNRDVADLWSDALRAYKGIVGTDLQPKFANVNEIIAFGTKEMNSFHKFRHNQKKVDKLRSLFMANIGYIETGAQQLVAAATPAFPPAAAIGTALTYMLSACKQVSADYDVVNAFFEDMNAFLQRITILESRLPAYPAYRNCLMDVFTSILKMCGFATKYIELGRLKKWVINMIKGEDSDLGGARKAMDTSLNRLQAATEYAILGNTEENNRMTVELQQNQDLQTEMIENQTKMLESVLEHQEDVKNDLKNIQKLLAMFDQRNRDVGLPRTSKAATKPATSNRVRTFFEDTVDPVVLYQGIKERFLPDTCQWIFEEKAWTSFIAPSTSPQEGMSILAIEGAAGHGKSHIAASVFDHLTKHVSGDTCVASFFFREQNSVDLATFCNGVNWIAIQAAEQNAVLCEMLNAEIRREDLAIDISRWQDVWKHLVVPLFPAGSSAKLCIIWDGLDELMFREKEKLLEFFEAAKAMSNSNISLICTTRPDKQIDERLQAANAHYLHVSSQKQVADLQLLIWQHLNDDDRLKRFSKFAKQSIVSALVERTDGRPPYDFLFCEHILRHFNAVGREPLVLKQLNSLPENWPALYKKILDDMFHHTSATDLPALRLLFKWLAFSDRALTLQECLGLLKMHGLDAFDLERELQGNSLSRFLRLAPAEERSAAGIFVEQPTLEVLNSDQTADESSVSDGDHPLRFHDRSTRSFFETAKRDEIGLRTYADQAHREIFVLCSQILCGMHPSVEKGLKKYAASEWAYHLSWTNTQSHLPEEEKLAVLESMVAIMTNHNNVAAVFEELDVDYDEQLWSFPDDYWTGTLKDYGKLGIKHESKLSASALTFYQNISADTSTAFVPLAKAHITNWLRAETDSALKRSYTYARQCIALTTFKNLLVEKDADSEATYEDDDEEDQEYDETEIISIFNAFEDTPKDGHAYLALASFLVNNRCFAESEARGYALQAIELLQHDPRRLEAQLVLANADIILEELDEALNAVDIVLKEPDTPQHLLRRAYTTLANIQKDQGKLEEVAKSYELARQADPQEPMSGEDLYDEFYLYLEQQADATLIDRVGSWKTTEKLTIMTWRYDGSGHTEFFLAAGRSGKMDAAIKIYEEVIELLNTVEAAAPIRCELARGKWFINGDAEGAKALLHENLDTMSDGYQLKFTEEDPSTSLGEAILLMADIIWEQYRMSSDRTVKAQLFNEIKSLTSKPLATSVAVSKSDLNHHTVIVSKMARKMATAEEFQTTLQSAFDACYEALVDDIGWNDWLNLINMAKIVSQLDGLEREAEILVSAQFSELDPPTEAKDKDEKKTGPDEAGNDDANDETEAGADEDDSTAGSVADDDDDDTKAEDTASNAASDASSIPPDDAGDLKSGWVECDGDCNPHAAWKYWKESPMYVCVVCRIITLCGECFEKRQKYNEDPSTCPVKGTYFCGRDHAYVEGPVEGWHGITNGVMNIDGEEPIEFRVWLEELRNDKWVKAWERFWLEE
ncbi:hypothetical protein CKM354_000543900 [Cercospora kikuchii]|uniref:Fungal STAND N-terminal Goodbye domain-containing protein n=1 Tax=Cercospora kikuchii TaxID=84275 RepID=A0A9P3CG85_9PEZI|nr:uncharacterized protein CKM354_000543900 [Cercospora kikuchii]GIZ42161.1 hypothetical protein CKM354_000543900 [Cercospora kikuchii]